MLTMQWYYDCTVMAVLKEMVMKLVVNMIQDKKYNNDSIRMIQEW